MAWRPGGKPVHRRPTKHVVLRFYAELKDFLGVHHRWGRVSRTFDVPGSVKDMIEACGVPHTEVDLILANGESVDFSYQVGDGDRISVYPVFEAFDISSIVRVRPQALRRVRFVLDGHLGRVARYLRLVGLDTAYSNTWSDHEHVKAVLVFKELLVQCPQRRGHAFRFYHRRDRALGAALRNRYNTHLRFGDRCKEGRRDTRRVAHAIPDQGHNGQA